MIGLSATTRNAPRHWHGYGDLVKFSGDSEFYNGSDDSCSRRLELLLSKVTFDDEELPSFVRRQYLVNIGLREYCIKNINSNNREYLGFEDVYYFFLDKRPFAHVWRKFTWNPCNKRRDYFTPLFESDRDFRKIQDFLPSISELLNNKHLRCDNPVINGLINCNLYEIDENEKKKIRPLVNSMFSEEELQHNVFQGSTEFVFPEQGADSRERHLRVTLSNFLVNEELVGGFNYLVTPSRITLNEEYFTDCGEFVGHEDSYLLEPDGNCLFHLYRGYIRPENESLTASYNDQELIDYNFSKPLVYSPFIKKILDHSSFRVNSKDNPIISFIDGYCSIKSH